MNLAANHPRQFMRRLKRVFVGSLFATLIAAPGYSEAPQRPIRGNVPLQVLLCKVSDAATQPQARAHWERKFIRAGTGGMVDFWHDMSGGLMNLEGSSVHGWYEMEETEAEMEALGRGGKFSACVSTAEENGVAINEHGVTMVVTHPETDIYGSPGRAYVSSRNGISVVAHEFAHGLDLHHSFSNDLTHRNADWAAPGQYGDKYDLMSVRNAWSISPQTQSSEDFGWAGPGLNAYHLDRMGWIPRDRILRFGANGESEEVITLAALTRPNAEGYRLVRIPIDNEDPNRYVTVEFRIQEDWDGAIPRAGIVIHEVQPHAERNYYHSVVIVEREGSALPATSYADRGIEIEQLSVLAGGESIRIRVKHHNINRCVDGYVWRLATDEDQICVPPARRTEVRRETARAAGRTRDDVRGLAALRCAEGYVWREAYVGDYNCVTPAARRKAAEENATHPSLTIAAHIWGPNACEDGYVWREIDANDWVCVTPQRRAQIREENNLSMSRRRTRPADFSRFVCREGFVHREAFDNDKVCTTPEGRRAAQLDNANANRHLAERNA